MTMRVDASVSKMQPDSLGAANPIKQSLQVATLKKALDSQKQEAEEVIKMLQPKGRVIDIRV